MEHEIPLDLYRTFSVIVSTGSISMAAKRLYVSQPAVSMAVKQLETKLGSPLLIRSSSGIRLTAEGKVLYEYISQAMNILEAGENKYYEMRNLSSGEFKIGASDTLLRHYLLSYIERFNNTYPHINIKVTNRTTYETLELLKSGIADIGFVNLPIDEKEIDRYEIHECLKIHDCLIGGKKYAHLAKKGIDLKSLGDYPLVMLENDSNSRRYIDSFLNSQGVNFKPTIELGSYDLLVEMAKINMGLAFVVKEFAKDFIDYETLFEIPLTPSVPERGIGLVKLKNVPLSFAASKFAETMNIF